MKLILYLLSTVGVLAAVILFAALWLKRLLDEVDQNPHGAPPEPKWREGYDD